MFLCKLFRRSRNYYAVFSLLPIAAGEICRTVLRRKIDVRVWTILAGGFATLVLYLPMIEGARSVYSRGFWSPVEEIDAFGFYISSLYPATLGFVAVLYLIVINWKPGLISRDGLRSQFPTEEIVVMWALLLSPPLTVGIALVTTKAYVFRYSLPALIGVAWLFAVFVWGCTKNRRTPIVVLSLLGVSFVAARSADALKLASIWRNGSLTERVTLALQENDVPPKLPIIVTSPLKYFELSIRA